MIKRKSFRNLGCAASAIVGIAAFTGFPLVPAAALTALGEDPFSGLTPLSPNNLAGLRGGFAVGVFAFDIGVVVSTSVNSASGVYTVTTTATLNPAGNVTNARTDFSALPAQANAGGNGSPQTQVTLLVVPEQTGEPATTQTAAAEPAAITVPVTVDSTELLDGGIIVSVEGTDFAIVHEITGQELVTLVQNTENGASLSTSVDMNVTIANYSQVLDNMTRNMPLIVNIGRDAGVASVQ
ncbi:MAG: hypothetical protein IMF05_12740 [Proteobacteria bacterium]|nr:hypothetical protein [Pseudomonadota bacterium]